jgi:hypothetical protein
VCLPVSAARLFFPQLIDIDTLIRPFCFSIRVLRATRDAKSARREQNRSVTGRELRRRSHRANFSRNGPSESEKFQGGALQSFL